MSADIKKCQSRRSAMKPGSYKVIVKYTQSGYFYVYLQHSLYDAIDCANFCAKLIWQRKGGSVEIYHKQELVDGWRY